MRYIVTTHTHMGNIVYLKRGNTTRLKADANRYTTRKAAENALFRRRMLSQPDSAWHHGYVIEDAPEPEYVDPQPNDGPARLAMLFPGLGNRKILPCRSRRR